MGCCSPNEIKNPRFKIWYIVVGLLEATTLCGLPTCILGCMIGDCGMVCVGVVQILFFYLLLQIKTYAEYIAAYAFTQGVHNLNIHLKEILIPGAIICVPIMLILACWKLYYTIQLIVKGVNYESDKDTHPNAGEYTLKQGGDVKVPLLHPNDIEQRQMV